MRIPQLQPLSVRNKTIMFTGGLNEEAAKLQLKPGELQDVLNYHEIAGPYSGYASLEGYERYDGQEAPSDVALDTAAAWANTTVYTEFDAGLTYSSIVTHGDYTFKCILDHTASTGANEPDSTTPGSNTWWELIDATADLEEIDVNREYTRTAILTVGNGASSGNCRGVAYWQQTVLAFRDNLLATAMEMWIDSPSGWTKTGIAGDNDFLPGGSVQSIKYKFADYNNGDEVLVIVDGVSYPRTWDGTTLTKVNHANLPDPVTEAAPFLCGTYNNRLFLAYRDGYMFFSAIDAPTDFDNITKSAGYLYFGDEITNIV